MVALYTLSDFGAVSLLSFEAFSYVIYLQYDAGARELAAASSLTLIAMALAVLTIESASRGKAQYHRTGVGAQRSMATVSLGRWRWPAFGFSTFICAVSLGMPLSVLGYWVAQGLQAGESLGLAWGTTFNSIYVSLLAAIASVAAALPLALLMVRYAGRLSAALERLTYVGFALPGIVVALSLVFFTANYLQPLYQHIVILIFAYVVLFLPAAVGAVRASLLQVSPRLEDASRGLGQERTPHLSYGHPPVDASRSLVGNGAGVPYHHERTPGHADSRAHRLPDPGHVYMVRDRVSFLHEGGRTGVAVGAGVLSSHGFHRNA